MRDSDRRAIEEDNAFWERLFWYLFGLGAVAVVLVVWYQQPMLGCETYAGTVTDIEQTANAAMTRIWRVTVEYKEPGRLHPMTVAFEMTDAEWYAVNLTIGSELEIVRKVNALLAPRWSMDDKRCPVEQGQ